MLGASPKRKEDARLLAGAGRFVEDIERGGAARLGVVRSQHAHARLRGVNLTAVRKRPGVLAAWSAADLTDLARAIPAAWGGSHKGKPFAVPLLAAERARYVGEPIAVVIAEDAHALADALEAVEVDYEPLEAFGTTDAALASRARVHEGWSDNSTLPVGTTIGDGAAAFARADVEVGGRFRHARLAAAPIENRGAIAWPDAESGTLTIWASIQNPYRLRDAIAGTLGIPAESVRVRVPDVGGGFGPKGDVYPDEILVAAAAHRLRRPVKWIESRRENLMSANHAREVAYEIEMGFAGDGRILAMRAVIHADIGAYVRTAALVPAEFGAALLPGPYRVPNYACDLWSVVTNKTPAGTLRSPGRPECNFVRERLLDQAAARLGIDAAEIRRRNLIRPQEMPYDCGTRSFGVSTVYDSGDFPGLFDELLRRLDYARVRAEQTVMNSKPSGPRRGIGLAIYVEKTGLGPFETTQVEARPDGRFLVDTGASSMGPGLETVLAQILGEALGLPASRFDVRHTDTSTVESGVGTYGSRGTVTAGNAAHLAAAKLIAEARQRAAERLAVPETEVTYASGVLTAGGRHVTLAELARERRLAVGASFEVPKVTYAGCAAAVVADVDPETGAVSLRRVVVGADVGRAVNPALVDGQLVGGVAFGIGNTMHESLVYDGEGQLLSSTLMDYALPAATDVPPVDGFYQEVRATTNPLGLRGLGECGNPGLGAATANAVCDALGPHDVSITALPLTAARVFESARPRRDGAGR